MFASQKTFISPKSVKALKETWGKPPAGVTNKPFSFIAKLSWEWALLSLHYLSDIGTQNTTATAAITTI